MSPVVDLVGVEKTFRDFWGRARVRALAPLTLSLERGEVLALLGPNGAGKSTAIKLVLGLLFPTRGVLSVFGQRPDSAAVRARIGYLPEETKLHAFLTARETLHLFGRLHGVSPRERKRRVSELLAMVGLSAIENRPVGEFSKGMARRIGLAVALVGDPDLLVLDEPTSGLDPLGTREIKDLITELRSRGRTVLLSSHLLDDVEDVADRVAILYGGRLVRMGTTEGLLTQGERVRIEFARPPGFDPRAAAEQVRERFAVEGAVDVDNPAERLETLFREVVHAAAAERSDISGAQAGGDLASFLGGEGTEHEPASATPEVSQPPASEVQPQAQPARVASTETEGGLAELPSNVGEGFIPSRAVLEARGETGTDAAKPTSTVEPTSAAEPADTPGRPALATPPKLESVPAPAADPAAAEPSEVADEVDATSDDATPAGRRVLAALTAPAPPPPEAPAAAPLEVGPHGRDVLADLLTPAPRPQASAAGAKLVIGRGRDVLGSLIDKGRAGSEPGAGVAEPAARPAPKLSAAGREVLDGLIAKQKPGP